MIDRLGSKQWAMWAWLVILTVVIVYQLVVDDWPDWIDQLQGFFATFSRISWGRPELPHDHGGPYYPPPYTAPRLPFRWNPFTPHTANSYSFIICLSPYWAAMRMALLWYSFSQSAFQANIASICRKIYNKNVGSEIAPPPPFSLLQKIIHLGKGKLPLYGHSNTK